MHFTNIYVIGFSPSPPLLLGESTFTVPRPSLKPSKKGPLQAIYI